MVVVTSRDRFARVFSLQTRQMKAKVYCKQALTCSLFSSEEAIKEIKPAETLAVKDDDDDDDDLSGGMTGDENEDDDVSGTEEPEKGGMEVEVEGEDEDDE